MFPATDSQKTIAAQSHSLPSHFEVRPAQAVDLASMAQILADSFHSPDGFWGWAKPLLRVGIYEDLKNRLRANLPHHICLVAFPDATNSNDVNLAGTIEMALRSNDVWHNERRYLYLSNLAVRPTQRRQGVAQQLLLNCEQVAISWGFQDLYLHVLENNHQARQLYFKLGYRLHQVDAGWNAWLGQPRQLFLHKPLLRPESFPE